AQELDKPRGRILKDDAIQEIAQQRPRSAEALERLRAVPSGFSRSKHGQGLVAAINEALSDPDRYAPEVERRESGGPPPRAPGERAGLRRVLWRKAAAAAGVAPRLIATSAALDRLAREANPDIPALTSEWRRELFGEKALELKGGRLALAASPKGVQFIQV